MKFTTNNGYMTLKIALPPANITRTIVVPECMTLEDLNDAIQCVMGWENSHLWQFEDGRNGPVYELPHEDDDFSTFDKRLTVDASMATLGKAFPKRGAKLTYEYDFGDGWDHVVTRMSDPKTAEIACVKSEGPDGIEDFGGQYRLAEFIDAMRKNPKDDAWADVMDWGGFDDPERLSKYLNGESAEAKTAKLKKELAHVNVVVPSKNEKPKKMSEKEQAKTLGLMFATTLPMDVWDVMQDALQHGGTCEFIDLDKTISPFLMTMFDGLEIKDGVQTPIHTDPSKLTVHGNWVEWYKANRKSWEDMRAPFDILESYALSVVHLYGAMPMTEFYEIILRYDPKIKLSLETVSRILTARALWAGIGYHIAGDMIVDAIAFSAKRENVDEDIRELRKMQREYPRWYPKNRTELFKWEDYDSYDRTPEADQLELVLHSLGRFSNEEVSEILIATCELIGNGLSPDGIYKAMTLAGFIEKLAKRPRQALLDALEKWSEVIRAQCLNGHTMREIRDIEHQHV